MGQFSVRYDSEELAERLRALASARGTSLNALIVSILEAAAGLDERRKAIERYATWSEADVRAFDAVLADQRQVEEDLWR
jgi:plasmid stability protein